jgi:hypothetical protein
MRETPTEEDKDGSAEAAKRRVQPVQMVSNDDDDDDDTDAGDPKVDTGKPGADVAGRVSKPNNATAAPLLQKSASQSQDDSLASLSESTATLQMMFERERERLRSEQAAPAAATTVSDRQTASSGKSLPADVNDTDSASIVIPPLSSIPSVLAPYNPMGLPALAPAPITASAPKADGRGLGAISWDEARRPFALQQPTQTSGSGSVAQPFPGMGSSLGLGLGGLAPGNSGVNAASGASAPTRPSESEVGWGRNAGTRGGEDIGLGLQAGALGCLGHLLLESEMSIGVTIFL